MAPVNEISAHKPRHNSAGNVSRSLIRNKIQLNNLTKYEI
jgi:hypothetical protein